MRFSTIVALAGAVSSVQAIGQLAFNLGVKDNQGNCKSAEEYKHDFSILSSYTKKVRVYAASDCNTLEILGPAAEEAGFTVFFGIWPNDDAHFQAEQDALKTYLPNIKKSTVEAITVGSEALYRADLTAQELSDKIDTIRDLLKDVKDSDGESYEGTQVGFVDSWNVLVDGGSRPAIQSADFVFANAFSYWQGQTQNNASYSFFDDIMQALQTIQGIKGETDINFWVGETGWPSEGTAFESSEPSVDNAHAFWNDAICAIRGWGINVIAFEAFDEAWKPDTSGTSDVEKYWGVWDADNKLKYQLSCDFSS
ncbi:Glucan endo-1,3-beta-glucosidase B [Wickerhamomyces ciferrii]|uniref:glucan 1,3-beta-glucosidase n=1 Tax=Wickerhamomyces ciferrii (strain ATCC 14091 / BCRC 22168 / CBS 111 / JCM 3599 / NBRC 0793 / NRRL Y-1031 F-60-10) TaxID=1206466 RepID=K0KDW4_WICCF|nr:Glucan endo-1,3-beta-glucosidase B [Wickerhamomyces ciferrii]CCH41121.1 Glucan endo-1,3-beta-glucosidase B [Wickerhamomyces ciferrii]